MTSLPFFQVDAFADRPLTGNPAAVMPLERWLDDAVMQAIAAENNLSETAFTVPSEQRRRRLSTCAGSRPTSRGRSVRPRDARRRPRPDPQRSAPLLRPAPACSTVTRRDDLLELDLPAPPLTEVHEPELCARARSCRTARPGSRKGATTPRSSRLTTRPRCARSQPDFAALQQHPPDGGRHCARRPIRHREPRVRALSRHRRGPGHRLGPRRAGAVLGRAARPQPSSPRSRRASAPAYSIAAWRAIGSCSAAIATR